MVIVLWWSSLIVIILEEELDSIIVNQIKKIKNLEFHLDFGERDLDRDSRRLLRSFFSFFRFLSFSFFSFLRRNSSSFFDIS